jgi:hypothetical protein
MGKIIARDESDTADILIRFKGIERYHEYRSIKEFTNEWRDYDEYMKEEVLSLEKPKSEARRRIDLFLRRIKNVPTNSEKDYYNWKARG